MPTRSCRKNTGPLLVSLIATATRQQHRGEQQRPASGCRPGRKTSSGCGWRRGRSGGRRGSAAGRPPAGCAPAGRRCWSAPGARISSASVSSSSQLSLRTALGPNAAVAVTATVSAPIEVGRSPRHRTEPPSTGTPSIADSSARVTERGPAHADADHPVAGPRRAAPGRPAVRHGVRVTDRDNLGHHATLVAPAEQPPRRHTYRVASSATRPGRQHDDHVAARQVQVEQEGPDRAARRRSARPGSTRLYSVGPCPVTVPSCSRPQSSAISRPIDGARSTATTASIRARPRSRVRDRRLNR